MIAANRGGRRSRRSRRSGSGARRGPRHHSGKTVNIGQRYGGYAVVYGLADPLAIAPNKYGGAGRASPFSIDPNQPLSDRFYNLKQNIPFIGSDAAHSNQRNAALLGLILTQGHKIPIISSLGRMLKVKIGRKTYRAW
jgi:hypothetical protein